MKIRRATLTLKAKFTNHFWNSAIDHASLNSRLLQLSVAIYLVVFIPILVISLGRHFYLQQAWLEVWSFYPSDPPGFMTVVPEKHAFGIHFFGDFLLPISWSQYPNPFLVDIPVNYPPIAIEFIGVFLKFGYRPGLLIYLLLMALASFVTVAFSVRKRSTLAMGSALATIGIASGPLLAAIDRGNIAGFSVGLLFLSGYFILMNQWRKAAIFIAIATSIKLYVVVLFIVFVFKRRWSELFLGAVITGALVLLPLSLYPGSFRSTIEGLLQGVSNFSIQSQDWILYCWNSSLVGGLYQSSISLNLNSLALSIYSNAQLVSLILSIPILYLAFKSRQFIWLSLISSFMLMSTLVPISYYYTLTWALAGLCLVFARANQIDTAIFSDLNKPPHNHGAIENRERKLLVATTIYLSILLIPMPLSLPKTSQFVCVQSVAPSVFFLATVFWLIYIIWSLRRMQVRAT